MLEEITLDGLRRIMSEALDKAFDEPTDKIRESRQRLAGLEQNTQQRRLAMGTDVKTNTKTRKRAEDAAAGQSMAIAVLQTGSKSARQVRPASA